MDSEGQGFPAQGADGSKDPNFLKDEDAFFKWFDVGGPASSARASSSVLPPTHTHQTLLPWLCTVFPCACVQRFQGRQRGSSIRCVAGKVRVGGEGRRLTPAPCTWSGGAAASAGRVQVHSADGKGADGVLDFADFRWFLAQSAMSVRRPFGFAKRLVPPASKSLPTVASLARCRFPVGV